LEKLVHKRLRSTTIGFSSASQPVAGAQTSWLDQAQTRDFIEFGFEPEFIGRLPVRVVCQQLSAEDLFTILKTSEGSIIRQYEQTFSAYGIEVLFRDDGLRRIAELASAETTGARGLMTVCERIFRDFKFELPSTQVHRFIVTRELVDNPAVDLRKLLDEHEKQERVVARQLAHDFARRFGENHQLGLQFTDAAAERLVSLAFEQRMPVREVCALRFKDFQFGLKLIFKNTGQDVFTIDIEAVNAPDKILSEWVVQSYRNPPDSKPAGRDSVVP
jgi:integrase